MGSVKDLRIIESATKDKSGIGIFKFSDRYSVFDWGEMPDHIPDKGKAIAVLGAFFFERAEENGCKTHYLGIESQKGALRLKDVDTPIDSMRVKLFSVVKPTLLQDGRYDYSAYKGVKSNFLIPLEVIYRNRLPRGSSVFKRLTRGEITPQELGLNSMPKEDAILSKPIFDVSTKLERIDRYIKWDEAERISGLSSVQIEKLKELLSFLNDLISREFEKIGLINEDGKIEFSIDENGDICIVDVFGTLDECRFTYEGIPVSKEAARIYYRKTEWFEALNRAKEKDREHFKEICESQPESLPLELKDAIANLYRYCTNKITGREWFKGVPDIKESISIVRKYT